MFVRSPDYSVDVGIVGHKWLSLQKPRKTNNNLKNENPNDGRIANKLIVFPATFSCDNRDSLTSVNNKVSVTLCWRHKTSLR